MFITKAGKDGWARAKPVDAMKWNNGEHPLSEHGARASRARTYEFGARFLNKVCREDEIFAFPNFGLRRLLAKCSGSVSSRQIRSGGRGTPALVRLWAHIV